MKRWLVTGCLIAALSLVATPLLVRAEASQTKIQKSTCDKTDFFCPNNTNSASKALHDLKTPDVSPPPAPQTSSESSASNGSSTSISRTVTYSVSTRGHITSNLGTFKSQANQTLNDSRGWSRLGVRFNEVPSGGDFTLVLSNSAQMSSFWEGCSSEYSCQTGRFVIINQDRWQGATPSWNNAGGSIRDYRHMVINHETGHWLGHGHASCPGAGGKAAVMQQQSISLQGCKFNPWPIQSEIWSSRLGI